MQETEFAQKHRTDTDEELIRYLKECADEIGRCPKKDDVVGYAYLKQRLGPWPRILERAGLKEKSQKRIDKEKKINFTENSKSVINHGSINGYALKAAKKLKKELNKPERIALEKEFAEKHANDTDEELFEFLKNLKRRYGKRLTPTDTVGYNYIVSRFGSWADVMGQITRELKQEKNERIENQ